MHRVITSKQAVAEVVRFYNDNLQDALEALYPNIDFKFDAKKEFLENFAKKFNFHPLVPDNWYYVTAQDIIEEVTHSPPAPIFIEKKKSKKKKKKVKKRNGVGEGNKRKLEGKDTVGV